MKPIETTLDERVFSLMQAAKVPGVSLSVVRKGAVEVAAGGVKDAAGSDAVNTRTVFDVASLSKPMVAYAVLQLVDAGVLDLDAPLSGFAPAIVPDDASAAAITARHVLTHTSGLPNLRGQDPLRMYFRPGAWFSYSSVGFGYLQSALESITGEPLEKTMRRLVFEPLGMRSSSFEWQAHFGDNCAGPHEGMERLGKHHPPKAQASYSLQTTAFDYGIFARAVLQGDRLKEATCREWLTPAASVPRGAAEYLGSRPAATEDGIGWGLGWGIEVERGTFFQWGKMSGIRAFVMGSQAEQLAVVLLTNSNTGLRLMDEVARSVLPGEHPAIRWLQACVWE